MSIEEEDTENLFLYGTLQTEAVQLATFSRRLAGQPDALVGYSLTMAQVQDQDFVDKSGTAHHRNAHFTGNAWDLIEGTVFTVTRQELEQADAYEPADYKRVLARLSSGVKAWVYVNIRE
jgi:gamma-glutamylcyclotransferase (GGCT)/AIG2-like uncharacterized protein YtfP